MAYAENKISEDDLKKLKLNLLEKPIILIGMMGAGKTSLGRRLAQVLGRKFIDSDIEIEKASAMSIADFFKKHGEAEFRKGETRVISRILKEKNTVIGTGGGAFMNEKTRAKIKAKTLSIWINADFEVLFERISRRPSRPLMQTENPRETLKNLIETRYPIYEKADLSVMSKDVPHDKVINQILNAIFDYYEKEAKK